MKKFLQIKEAFIELLRDKSPCNGEYRRVLESETEQELLEVIKDNLGWCSQKGVCPDSFLQMFTPEILLASGVANTGEGNTGLGNTGDRNTGYWNTGDRNTGVFCTGAAPFPMFNQSSTWTEQDFLNSQAFNLLCNVYTKQWVPSSHMTEEEKQEFPSHETCEGYLKDIPFKEAFQNAWHNWSADSRKAFTDLPNFNSDIFFEITGVKVSEK